MHKDTHTTKHTNTRRTNKYKHSTKKSNSTYKFKKNERNSNTPENTNGGGPSTRSRNYGTRQGSGGPDGAECSLLTHFRGEPENVIPMSGTQNRVCSVTTSSGTRRHHSPAALYANTQLRRSVAAVCARTRFHATGMPCA